MPKNSGSILCDSIRVSGKRKEKLRQAFLVRSNLSNEHRQNRIVTTFFDGEIQVSSKIK